MRQLNCQMVAACAGQVTHIDEKGYVYCLPHGTQRRASYVRCRALRPWELKLLQLGKPVPSYRPIRKGEVVS